MNDGVKKRLAALEKLIKPVELAVAVEMPDGSIIRKSASEWWENRHEWPLADFDRQDNRASPVLCLSLAKMADDGIKTANSAEEVAYLENERDEMLRRYFRESVRS